MIIDIDQHGDVPLYEQLHRRIIAGIANDELAPGDQLPSVRSLAVDLGINLHTVNKAYALLRDEGYIAMRRGSGAVVADRGEGAGADQAANDQYERMNEELLRLALAHKARGGDMESFLEAARRQCLNVYRLPGRSMGINASNNGSNTTIVIENEYRGNTYERQ